jgi:beta-1,4-mannooligosaccharide/beta-1,4-mannosyl-N-acetylglucosamine phosphorylase
VIEHELFERSELNPIINPRDIPYACDCVCNPAATLFNGETLLLLRVIDQLGSSHITVARSKDGESDWQIDAEPLLAPTDRNLPYEVYGCEDPRVSFLEDRGEYVITYTGFSPLGAGVCIATTKDFKSVNRYGLVLAPNNKDASVFPRKIGGRYWMLHRPALGSMEHIWLAESEDLIHWGRPWMIIEERGGPWWDGEKVGGGPPPIETEDGWLIIFHGVQQTSHGPIYRVGLALLDLEDPRKVIRRLPRWVFGPKENYESTGLIPGVVFPTGAIVNGDDISLYYGAADTRIALARGKVSTLLAALREAGK